MNEISRALIRVSKKHAKTVITWNIHFILRDEVFSNFLLFYKDVLTQEV